MKVLLITLGLCVSVVTVSASSATAPIVNVGPTIPPSPHPCGGSDAEDDWQGCCDPCD